MGAELSLPARALRRGGALHGHAGQAHPHRRAASALYRSSGGLRRFPLPAPALARAKVYTQFITTLIVIRLWLLSKKRTGHRTPPISTQERTQAHIVCCLPCGAEGLLLLP